MGKNIKYKMYNVFSNNFNALYHSKNITFTTMSKPCPYIFLKFDDRCKGFTLERS